MKYHCYISAYDSVYHADIDACSATEAASQAARQNGIQGRWTVIPGDPVYVDIVERTTYEASLAGPEPR